jgi:spore coat protein U-like protein
MKVEFKFCFLTMITVLCLAASGTVYAASTTISATATVSTATITLTPVQNLDFGTIVAATDSNILIDATGGAAAPSVDSGTATITVAGNAGEISVDSPVTATVDVDYAIEDSVSNSDQIDDGGGNSMVLTAASMYQNSNTGGSNPGQLSLTAGVTSQLYVGGVLQINAAQAAGTYTGTVTVTVNY